jgi:glycerol-3-phosphate dehydrogenase (NAD(P)+)
VRECSLVVIVPPSFAVRSTTQKIAPYLRKDAVLVSATKGIESETGKRMSEIVAEETGKKVVVLSGPSHAEEVSRKVPTGVVAACEDRLLAELVQEVFMNDRFRVYTSSDPVGVELGAAMKNVIALCAGVCDGLGYGDNTKALLMTRGLTEVARLGMKLGSRNDTFAGLTGIGDLIVTCTSMHSRNRRAGILIGSGMSPQEAMKEVGAVVEGYYAAKSVKLLADKMGVDMPITQAAYSVLYEGAPVGSALTGLMTRKKGKEIEDAGWS